MLQRWAHEHRRDRVSFSERIEQIVQTNTRQAMNLRPFPRRINK
jgi:hypothetical protein